MDKIITKQRCFALNKTMKRTSEQIKAEIVAKFGFVPPFFDPALPTPQILENLWQQTLTGYINNPLPAFFKEKLSAYLARFCSVPYCMICHSCTLRPLGMKAREVLQLLETPVPLETSIDEHLKRLMASEPLIVWPHPNSLLEESLLACAFYIAIRDQSEPYCHQLRRILGARNYQYLIVFIAYVKTCHAWMEAHPEVSYEADLRVQTHLSALLAEEPNLAEFFCNYQQKVKQERQSRAEKLAELAERKRSQQALKKAYQELEVRVKERTAELAKANEELQKEIRDRKQAEERLFHNAFHDPLTNLPNRALFMERLRHSTALTQRSHHCSLAVLFLDLDRFKIINDSLGHLYGDKLLSAVAEKLKANLRPGDTVARLGGDEFVILLENIYQISDVTRIADRIQKDLALPFNLDGQEVFTSASIGIALSHESDNHPESLLRNADIAMYRAKSLGKACYAIFSSVMHEQVRSRLQLETALRWAIERQELQLHYQPIVRLETGKIVGFEALVRWQHPEQGLLSPAHFIPVAEETGLILPLGQWVLGEACRQLSYWHIKLENEPSTLVEALPLTISVNISGKQFAQPNLSEQVREILQQTQINASGLKLEITESVLMNNAQTATDILLQLAELGIQLHIDDFGTGYSSLSYLHQFSVNALKIDRSFISRIEKDLVSDSEAVSIVQTMVDLTKNLTIDAIAEGIETAEQLARLKELQCQFGQGYFFYPPLDSQSVELLLGSRL
jgi:diguanylate cyclase (GGDEF)-like protein